MLQKINLTLSIEKTRSSRPNSIYWQFIQVSTILFYTADKKGFSKKLSFLVEENAAKTKERQLMLSNFQTVEPKKWQTPLKISIDDDPEWDPFEYEEELMWNLPDPNILQQLNQYYQSYEYYESQFSYEDGQFDDVKSDDENESYECKQPFENTQSYNSTKDI